MGDQVRRLLVPLDGSTVAEAALGPAQELARAFAAELILLQVDLLPPPDTSASRGYLEDIAGRLWAAEIPTEIRIDHGYTAAAITRVAWREGADLVVLATHGRTGLSRVVLGSVAGSTLQHAGVPVLVMRADATRPSVHLVKSAVEESRS